MVLRSSPPPEFFICREKHFLPNEEHVTRIYERSVLILMTEGTLSFIENGETVTLGEGEYYIQRQHLLQQGVPLRSPPSYYYIEFNGSYGDGVGIPLRGEFDKNHLLPLAIKLHGSYQSGARNDFYLSSQMMRIFAELDRDRDTLTSTPHLIKRHIESEYASNITLPSLAKKFGYTEDYVTRLFKREFGVTPHCHLINVRLEHALWLLENTDITTERAAIAVGYRDLSSFWRAFKKKYAFSPGAIRNAKKPPQ